MSQTFTITDLPVDTIPADGGFFFYEVAPGEYRRATVANLKNAVNPDLTGLQEDIAATSVVASEADGKATDLVNSSIVTEQSKGYYNEVTGTYHLRFRLVDESFVEIPFAEFVAPLQEKITWQSDGVTVTTGPKTINFVGGGAALSFSNNVLTVDITGTPRANLVFAEQTLTSYPNLVGWWDASDATTVTESSGAVSQITDKSTNAVPFVQADTGLQPTFLTDNQNGLSVLSFDGTEHMTANASGNVFDGEDTALTIHMVIGSADLNLTMVALGFGSSANTTAGRYLGLGSGAKTYRWNQRAGGTSVDVNTPVSADNKMHCVTVAHAGTAVDVWVDGYRVNSAVAQDVPTIAANLLTLGGWGRSNGVTSPFTGRVGELALFTGKQTDAVIKEIHGHLMRKWFEVVASTDIIFSLGQSNMVGKANPSTYAADLPAVPTGTGLMWEEGPDVFIPIKDPIGDGTPYGGPLYAFSNEWATQTGRNVHLVPRAIGSTSLLDEASSVAASGHWEHGVAGTLYTAAVAELNAALTAFASNSIFTLNEVIVLWAQGESDATALFTEVAGVTALAYQSALIGLFNALKTDVSIPPSLFLVSLLGIWNGTGDREAAYVAIRQAQTAACQSVAGAYVAYTGAATFDSSLMYDTQHYTQVGYNQMGEGLAQGGALYARTPAAT